MTERRRRTPWVYGRMARLLRADRAVSPVIGMIMVLAISVVGISAILYWGLPSIDEMKANVEFRSVQSQFQELDGTVKELVAGTTEKTAKRWQPSINRGSVNVYNGTEGWLFATDLWSSSADHNVTWMGFADGDANFTLANNGTTDLTSVKVEAAIITGTSTSTTLNVSLQSAGSTVQMVGADLLLWSDGGTEQTFSVYRVVSGTVYENLTGATYRFRVYAGSSLVAEAWYVDTGRIDYTLHAGLGTKTLSENNGAILSGDGVSHAIINTPSIPPQTDTGGVHRFFGRAIVLHGSASFAGENRFDLLISLYSTATLASYDCALADQTDCVESSKIFIFGTHKDPWYDYLSSQGRGYTFTETADGTHLYDRADAMGYTLLQSVILLSG